MINYKKIYILSINDKIIDEVYKKLLKNKYHFIILDINGILNILTKEKSIFKIDNEQQFLESFKKDIYYKTIINYENITINKKDLFI